MTKSEIARASTKQLVARENALRDTDSFRAGFLLEDFASGAYDAAEDARWAEIDAIREELVGREHDLSDPSAGIPGLHLPS